MSHQGAGLTPVAHLATLFTAIPRGFGEEGGVTEGATHKVGPHDASVRAGRKENG